MPSLPPEMIVVLAPFAQLFSDRVWVPCPSAGAGSHLGAGQTHGEQLFAGDGVGLGGATSPTITGC